jgi:hypothetical protein
MKKQTVTTNVQTQPTYLVLPQEPSWNHDGEQAYHYFRELSSQDQNWSMEAFPTTLGSDYTIFRHWHDEDTYFWTKPMPWNEAFEYHKAYEEKNPINVLFDDDVIPF